MEKPAAILCLLMRAVTTYVKVIKSELEPASASDGQFAGNTKGGGLLEPHLECIISNIQTVRSCTGQRAQVLL